MNEILFQLNDRGNAVRDIHRKLASGNVDLGPAVQAFLRGPVSELYNEDMARAVAAFQSAKGLPATGLCDRATWRALDREAGSVYGEVLQFELDALRGEGMPDGVRPADEDQVIARAHGAALAGLTFSGGGIRSATFNLGILQALAENGLLRDFDYLSTVSGGGYIGCHFSKWLQRLGGDIGAMEEQLTPGSRQKAEKAEPKEIRFLRQYSNYLTPKTGFFSVDTWSILATYVRNTALNMAILVALLGALMLLPRLLLLAFGTRPVPDAFAQACAVVAVAAFVGAVFFIALSISAIPDPSRSRRIYAQSQASVIACIVLPLLLAALCGGYAVWQYRVPIGALWTHRAQTPAVVSAWTVVPGLAFFACWAAGWSTAQWKNRRLAGAAAAPLDARLIRRILKQGIGHLLCAVIALGVGTLLLLKSVSVLAAASALLAPVELRRAPTHVLVFGLPFMLCIFGLSMILSVGLVGRMYGENSREWWSRQGAWTSICALSWLALTATSLYAPALVTYAVDNAWGGAMALAGWAGATVSGVLLGRSPATDRRNASAPLERIAVLTPYVFAAGALVLIAALAQKLGAHAGMPAPALGAPLAAHFAAALDGGAAGTVSDLLLPFGLLLLAGYGLSRRVDINRFSLYTMYRNRLVRAYLGASNEQRKAHPFTGFDPNDDVHFDDLRMAGGRLQRPYHIVNAALNLVNGKELAWQTRKAAAFTFTPAFCGFEMPSMGASGKAQIRDEAARGCFRATAAYRRKHKLSGADSVGIELGMALAVSGAAVSPSMGYHSSPPLAFLMTMFNVRLGRWFANPRKRHWRTTSPKFGLRSLLSELFGHTDADADYVYLSDGGHFENLGLYELLRRRCRLIVVVDASADGALDFEDLGNAIRKCGTDLHIDINIDVGKIDLSKGSEFSTAHCVTGQILYEKVDQGARNGTLLYIKPSLTGTEFADVLNYRKTNKSFPHQTTADQWFDETQFESYRSLGYHIGTQALGEAAAHAGMAPIAVTGKPAGCHDIDRLCAELVARWGPPGEPAGKGTGAPISMQSERERRKGERERRHGERRQA